METVPLAAAPGAMETAANPAAASIDSPRLKKRMVDLPEPPRAAGQRELLTASRPGAANLGVARVEDLVVDHAASHGRDQTARAAALEARAHVEASDEQAAAQRGEQDLDRPDLVLRGQLRELRERPWAKTERVEVAIGRHYGVVRVA